MKVMKGTGTNGYAGNILRVDLSSEDVSCEPTMKYAKEWLGGSGIGQWILYNEVKPWVTPYAPANKLIVGAGPLLGTPGPAASRLSGDSINALTNGVGSSNCDSHFGPGLKFAGYDQIILEGRARKPVYIWITDDHVQIRDATNLWGRTTWETLEAIRHELGDDDVHVLSIGPAGENLVRGACIIQDTGRAMGRCGLGGVMGSKNLKAVAVRGSGGIRLADAERFMRAVDKARDAFDKAPIVTAIRKFGVPVITTNKQAVGGIPYKNFQYLTLPEDLYKSLDNERLNANYRIRNVSFMGCPYGCGRYFFVNDGQYAGLRSEGFQFEQVADFGGKLAVHDPTFIIKLNAYCNQMGMDVDLVAGAIAWAMECYQRGILKPSDADGLKLEWGDAGVILELARKMAYREGFGATLAEGNARAATILGRNSSYYALNLKGQDLYEVIRGCVGWGLGACTSTRGGGHTTGAPASENFPKVDEELLQKVYGVATANKPLEYEGKAKLVHYMERLHRVNNSFGVCHLATTWHDASFPGFPELAEMYSAATGLEMTEDDLIRATSRMLNVEKAFNLLRTDLDRKDDYPPARCMEEPIPTGKNAGWKIEKKAWDNLLDEYYEMNNWDKKTSFPTRKCLEDLGLKSIADDLEKIGKLGST
jgi:aldehyde:ferredoxin oxidoreductase